MSTYRSPIRERHARQTRLEIAHAALRLFLQHGYTATSVAAIAKEAGVAVQTVYAVYGSKRQIVLALVDAIDELADIADLVARLGSARDPRELLRTQVALARRFREGEVGEVVGVLLAAAESEPELAAVAEEGLRRHRRGAERVAQALDEQGVLREGVNGARAAAVISTLTWHPTYRQLVAEHGWSGEDWEAWVAETLEQTLLAPRMRSARRLAARRG